MSIKHFPILFDELHILTKVYRESPEVLKNPEYEKDLMNKSVQILEDFENRIHSLKVNVNGLWDTMENLENRIIILEGKK